MRPTEPRFRLIPEFEVNEISFPLVEPLRDRYLGDYRLGSGFLLGAMGVVLLIACANIGGLVAVHSMGRSREFALRSALGASRSRLVRAWMIGVFSAVALLLAVAGLYGVVSHTVGLRRREIGIRLAIGAQRGQVFRQVLRQGLSLVGVGVLVGLAAAFFLARGLSAVLVGVTAREPVVYLSVTLLLIAVAAVASILPARRAAATDPVTVLRRD